MGVVAHVTRDGLGVNLSPLVRDAETKEYVLMKSTSLTLPTGSKFSTIAHVVWSATGTELAVTDVNGRVCIYQTMYALNRVLSVTTQVFEQVDILGGIIGIEWLSVGRTVCYFGRLFIDKQLKR